MSDVGVGSGPRCTIIVALFVVGALVAAACGDTDPGAAPVKRETAIYTSAIRWASVDHASGADPPERIFVEQLDGVEIGIETQVEIVAAFEEWSDVRFIDERAEAVQSSQPDRPVRGDAVLVSLGPIREGEDGAAVLHVERYRDARDRSGYRLVLREQDGAWVVTQVQPEPVEEPDEESATREQRVRDVQGAARFVL